MSRTSQADGLVVSAKKFAEIVRCVLAWFRENARDLPWRRTLDPYGIWISEIMLQQTQVKTVIPYWERWMGALPDIRALAGAKPERVLKLWEGLGYYSRARNLHEAAHLLCLKYDGRFPDAYEEVLALPGIGRYTAGAICSIAYNQPTSVLDGNVMRVLCRLFGLEVNPREKQKALWGLAEALVQQAGKIRTQISFERPIQVAGNCSSLNQGLMELGAVVCTPKEPECKSCPVRSLCEASRSGRVEQIPNVGPRAEPVRRRFVAFIVEHKGRFLLRQRPAGAVNGQFWEFPNVEVTLTEPDLRKAARELLGSLPRAVSAFHTLNHTITRYRIKLEAYRVELKKPCEVNGPVHRWATPEDLQRLPLTSAHRKVAQALRQRIGGKVLPRNTNGDMECGGKVFRDTALTSRGAHAEQAKAVSRKTLPPHSIIFHAS